MAHRESEAVLSIQGGTIMQAQMQTQNRNVQNNWKMRDFITLAIFNVLMIIVMTMVDMFARPLHFLAVGGITALVNGPVYMVMSNKIGKRGVLFFTALLTGLYLLAFGFVYFLITLAVVGVLCELIMWGKDTYKHPLRNALGYGIFYVGYSLCGAVPFVFFREQYLAILSQSYPPSELDNMVYYFSTPSMVLIMCAVSLAGAFAGCFLGNTLLKKHVKKAKLV